MPWQELSIVSQRIEFVHLARQDGANIRDLCRRYGVSPPTAYKWLNRVEVDGALDLGDCSRRPHTSPWKTPDAMEKEVLQLRKDNPTWGGRKISARLIALGHTNVPVPSTVTEVLRRHGKLDGSGKSDDKAPLRFEYDNPNDLWQMDFKGHFAIKEGRCHPLTILDDHSRFSISIRASTNELGETVQNELTACFRLYGLPKRILADNGSPWSAQGRGITKLEAWMMRLDIKVMHGRICHPQTQGKDERFHRTLKNDVLQYNAPEDLGSCQRAFDKFRSVYNHERPHEALGMQPPISRYSPSSRAYPEMLPPIEYCSQDEVRKVSFPGQIHFKNQRFIIGQGLIGQHVALRQTVQDGVYDVVYCSTIVRQINLHKSNHEV
jgi:transposase InsO family protein